MDSSSCVKVSDSAAGDGSVEASDTTDVSVVDVSAASDVSAVEVSSIAGAASDNEVDVVPDDCSFELFPALETRTISTISTATDIKATRNTPCFCFLRQYGQTVALTGICILQCLHSFVVASVCFIRVSEMLSFS